MRLIDADALKKLRHDYIQGRIKFNGSEYDLIDKCPTIDPESLRPQGEWVEWYPPTHMIMTGEELLYRCSACDAKYADVEGYRYCPYCGAKMKGAGEDA